MSGLGHEQYMRRAIELAQQFADRPFGSVIVDSGEGGIVAEGWNRTTENPLWHGEIDALNRLSEARRQVKRQQLSLYTTAEPCPMCQSAILWTGIGTVVYGTSIRFLQSQGWRQIDILAEEIIGRTPFANCKLIGGVLEKECNALFGEPRKWF